MKNKFVNILYLIVFLTSSVGVSVAAENAFGSLPIVNNPSQSAAIYSGEPIDPKAHPLLQSAVTSNIIIGIIISPSIRIASIRTQSGDQYFVTIGDKLGNAEGVITDIKPNAVEVTEKDKVISLAVRNRSVADAKEE
jgi:hypothetical protein